MGYFAEHELVGDDAEGEVVGFKGVVLFQDDLRGHVAGGAAGLGGVVVFAEAGDAEVGEAQVAAAFEH